jgi:hypothetical protein
MEIVEQTKTKQNKKTKKKKKNKKKKETKLVEDAFHYFYT